MNAGGAMIRIVRDRWHRDIGLDEETWYDHIVFGHRVLRGREAAVAQVVTHPHRVMYDAAYEDRECYYRSRMHPRYPDHFLKVCVEFESGDFGMVITAFLTPTIRSDEGQRWP
jgi:hypothetical protein